MNLFTLFLATAFALTVPPAAGGSITELGVDVLTDSHETLLETSILKYEERTGNEIGIVLVSSVADYAESFDELLRKLDNAGYTPNGIRLVLSLEDKQLDISHEAAWERAGVWNDTDSLRIAERALYPNLAEDDFAEATSDFIMDVQMAVPESVASLTEKANQADKTRAAVTGELTRRTWIIVLVLVAVALGLYAAYGAIQRMRLRRNIRTVETFYNEMIPLFEADLATIETSKDSVGEALKSEYTAFLSTLGQTIEQWLEQAQKPLSEARELAHITEEAEDELTAFVNDPEVVSERLNALQAEHNALQKRLTTILESIDL